MSSPATGGEGRTLPEERKKKVVGGERERNCGDGLGEIVRRR